MERVCAVIILLAIMVGVSLAQVPAGNTYVNSDIGFEITKPDGWVFLTAQQNEESLKRTKLDDKQLQKAMAKYATAPLVAIAKHPNPYDDLNPSIQVNVKPCGGLKGTEPVGLLDIMLPFVEKAVEDYKLVQEPIAVELDGIESAYAQFNFTKVLSDSTSIVTASELWVVPNGDYFVVITARTRQDQANGTREEIGKILETVKIRQE